MKYIIIFLTLSLMSLSATADRRHDNGISIQMGDIQLKWSAPYNRYYRWPKKERHRHHHHGFYNQYGHINPQHYYNKRYKPYREFYKQDRYHPSKRQRRDAHKFYNDTPKKYKGRKKQYKHNYRAWD